MLAQVPTKPPPQLAQISVCFHNVSSPPPTLCTLSAPYLCPWLLSGVLQMPSCLCCHCQCHCATVAAVSSPVQPTQLKVGKKRPFRKTFLGSNVPGAPQRCCQKDPAWWAHIWDPSTLELEARELCMSSRPVRSTYPDPAQRAWCCWGNMKVAQQSIGTRSHI